MNSPLFRREAQDQVRNRALGEVLAILPPSLRSIVVAAALFGAVFVAFCVFGQYARKVHVTGFLAPDKGFVKVFTRDAGTIVNKYVEEGQSVRKGDVLFVVSLDRSSEAGGGAGRVAVEEIQRRKEALKRERTKLGEIGRIQVEQLQTRILELSAELKKIGSEIDLQSQRIETLRKTSARYSNLAAEHFISDNQFQQQLGVQLEQEVALAAMERNKLTIARDLDATRRQIPELELRSRIDISSLERQASSLDQDVADFETRRELQVSAPVDGIATAIQAEAGQFASPNFPLLSIIPAGSVLEARLLAPAAAVGFIRPGKEVNLRYAAYPFQRFGHRRGTVQQVTRTVVNPSESPTPVKSNEPYYVVLVGLDQQFVQAYGDKLPLRAGMTLEADVLLDRRPIYHWILEPLFSIEGRV
jgi:membrane fusion protein